MPRDRLEKTKRATSLMREGGAERAIRSEQAEVRADMDLVNVPSMRRETSETVVNLCYELTQILCSFAMVYKLTGDQGTKLMMDEVDKACMYLAYVGLMLSSVLTDEEKTEFKKWRNGLDKLETVQ